MKSNLSEYFAALERIKKNRPKNVDKGRTISNDLVSMEAGRQKGSIKKSRPGHALLIAAIRSAADQQKLLVRPSIIEEDKSKATIEALKEERDAALGRELSLVHELTAVRKKLAKLTGENILPIRRLPSTRDTSKGSGPSRGKSKGKVPGKDDGESEH